MCHKSVREHQPQAIVINQKTGVLQRSTMPRSSDATDTFMDDMFGYAQCPHQAREATLDDALDQLEASQQAFAGLQALARFGHGNVSAKVPARVPIHEVCTAVNEKNEQKMISVVTGVGADYSPRQRTLTAIVWPPEAAK